MTWMAPKLKHRIQIRQGVDTPNDDGGFDRSYLTIVKVWASMKEHSEASQGFVASIRGVNVSDVPTHEFKIRYSAVINSTVRAFGDGFGEGLDASKRGGLGKSFDSGFEDAFDEAADLNPVKSDYFIFLERGDARKGKLFKVMGTSVDENNREYIRIKCREIEEVGTGWPE